MGSRIQWRAVLTAQAVCALTLVSSASCHSPTEPTQRLVESFATPVEAFVGSTPPDFSGTWNGEYVLADCRSAAAAACKDAPVGSAMQLNLLQTGASVSGVLMFAGQTTQFQGIVTNQRGLAGSTPDRVSLRVAPLDGGLAGFMVRDTYQSGQLYMSKRYDLIVPMQRR